MPYALDELKPQDKSRVRLMFTKFKTFTLEYRPRWNLISFPLKAEHIYRLIEIIEKANKISDLRKGTTFVTGNLHIKRTKLGDKDELLLFQGWWNGEKVKKHYRFVVPISEDEYPEFREMVLYFKSHALVKAVKPCDHYGQRSYMACTKCHELPRYLHFLRY